MKALFAHDHKFILNKGRYYTSGGLPDHVLSRYVEAFDELVVAARIIPGKETGAENQISNQHIVFKNILDGKKKTIKQAVKDVDIVIARVPSLAAVLAVYYARYFNKKLCVEVVGDAYSYYYHGGMKGKVAAPLMVLAEKWCARKAENVIYVSRFFLQKRYPTKGHVLVCPDVSFPIPDENVLWKRLNKIETMVTGKAVAGLIGSLDVNYRGHRTLLLAAAELKKRGIILQVRFLGGGSKERWIKLAKNLDIVEETEFCGTLPNGIPVLNWIDQIDILVMPTKQETLGRAIIEGMSRGCPILGSVETAIWEQIGSDCLFHADDYVKLAELIERLLEDHEYMGFCAKENFWRSFKYDEKKFNKMRKQFFENMKQGQRSR